MILQKLSATIRLNWRHSQLCGFKASPEGELIGSACDPITLALLASCCTSLHQVICKPDLVKRRAEDWSLNGHCCLLEHLAFNLAMSEPPVDSRNFF